MAQVDLPFQTTANATHAVYGFLGQHITALHSRRNYAQDSPVHGVAMGDGRTAARWRANKMACCRAARKLQSTVQTDPHATDGVAAASQPSASHQRRICTSPRP